MGHGQRCLWLKNLNAEKNVKNMENKLCILVNKITDDALFEFDKKYNSRMIVRPYSVFAEMLTNNKDMCENLIIMSEEEYFLSRKKE